MGLMDLLNDDDRRDFGGFADRFESGPIDEGYDDREALDRHRRVNEHLDDDQYEHSAREAFSRMEPDQRRQFGRELRCTGRERGYDFVAVHAQSRRADNVDPGVLAGCSAASVGKTAMDSTTCSAEVGAVASSAAARARS